jgi:hypothetical protein
MPAEMPKMQPATDMWAEFVGRLKVPQRAAGQQIAQSWSPVGK